MCTYKKQHASIAPRGGFRVPAKGDSPWKSNKTLGGCNPLPFQVSPIGIIPKKHKPNKWRLIADLSSPKDKSVNDGIATEWSTLGYATMDHLAALICKLGRGVLLVKADIKEAYRMVPVHPHDRWLLGMQWELTGRGDCMWTQCSPLAYGLPLKYSQQWLMQPSGSW